MKIREYQNFRSCWRKRAYGSEKKAWEIARKFRQRPYHCGVCKLWHLATRKTG